MLVHGGDRSTRVYDDAASTATPHQPVVEPSAPDGKRRHRVEQPRREDEVVDRSRAA